jgi:hypothetical protein
MRTIKVWIAILGVVALYVFRIGIIILGSMLYIYLLPGVIASHRHYPRASTVYWICALFGWTLLVWLGCLLFSLSLTKHANPEVALA